MSQWKYSIIFFLFLSSCASYFLKKNCEQTNWFEYGEKLALSGKRVDEDSFLQQCRKSEADIEEGLLDKGFKKGRESYCKPEGAFLTGKRGDFMNHELCSGVNVPRLKEQHALGVREHCQKSNGFSVGALGREYNGICPKDIESEFIKEFNRGRKRFLLATIQAKETDIQQANENITRLQKENGSLKYELGSLAFLSSAPANTHTELRKKKESLQYQSQSLERQISQEESRQGQLRKEIQTLRIQLETLDVSD